MKKHITLLGLSLIMLVMACKKSDVERIDNQDPVYAGIFDTSRFIYQVYNPSIFISSSFDSTINYYSGADSIDLDGDGVDDLFLMMQYKLESDSSLSSSSVSHVDVRPLNSYEIQCSEVTFYIGLGQTATMQCAGAFTFNMRIDNKENWIDIPSTLWTFPYGTMIQFPYGNWIMENSERYLPLRVNKSWDKKYGWLKIKMHSLTKIELVSYAMEK